MNGAFGVLAALYERARTGKGRVVRTSLLASVVGVHAYHGTAWTVGGVVPKAQGNHHASIAPYGAFRCADGMIQIACGNDAQWRKLAPILGIDPEDPRYATNSSGSRTATSSSPTWRRRSPTADRAHWLGLLAEAGIPAGRDPQHRRGLRSGSRPAPRAS